MILTDQSDFLKEGLFRESRIFKTLKLKNNFIYLDIYILNYQDKHNNSITKRNIISFVGLLRCLPNNRETCIWDILLQNDTVVTRTPSFFAFNHTCNSTI